MPSEFEPTFVGETEASEGVLCIAAEAVEEDALPLAACAYENMGTAGFRSSRATGEVAGIMVAGSELDCLRSVLSSDIVTKSGCESNAEYSRLNVVAGQPPPSLPVRARHCSI